MRRGFIDPVSWGFIVTLAIGAFAENEFDVMEYLLDSDKQRVVCEKNLLECEVKLRRLEELDLVDLGGL